MLRNGQERDVSVTLGELPEKAGQSGSSSSLSENSPMRRVQVDNLTPSVAREL
jgi:hypothetical protein